MKETCKRCKEENCTPWYYSKDLQGHVCQQCSSEIFYKLDNAIKIGKYSISIPFIDERQDSLWITKNDGEGMEYKIEKFEKLLDEFWDKEF